MRRMNLRTSDIGFILLVIGVIVSLTACATTGGDRAAPSDYRGRIWEIVLSGGLDSKFLLATADIPGKSSELVNGNLESQIKLDEYGAGLAKIRVKGELNHGALKATLEGQAEFGSGKAPLWGELKGHCLGPRCSGTYSIKYAEGDFKGPWKGQVYNREPINRTWSFGGGEDKPVEPSDNTN